MKNLLALLLFIASSASGFSQDRSTKAPFTIVIEAEQPTVASGADIWIKVQLSNKSKEALDESGVSNDFTGLDSNFLFEVSDVSGRPARMVEHPVPPQGRPVILSVASGETLTQEQRINKLYEILAPGKYAIQVSRRASNNPEDGVIHSNTITITVEPAAQPFSITISTATPIIKIGSELRVAIKLTNITDHTITSSRTISEQTAEFSYSVEVVNAEGKSPPETAYFLCYHFIGGDTTHVCARIASLIQFPLRPGESLDDEAVITNLYDIHIPGSI